MDTNTSFRAYAKDCGIVADTPQAAALAFFDKYPNKRKCNIIEGKSDGAFFTVAYNRNAWPKSYKDVTKKLAVNLPAASVD